MLLDDVFCLHFINLMESWNAMQPVAVVPVLFPTFSFLIRSYLVFFCSFLLLVTY